MNKLSTKITAKMEPLKDVESKKMRESHVLRRTLLSVMAGFGIGGLLLAMVSPQHIFGFALGFGLTPVADILTQISKALTSGVFYLINFFLEWLAALFTFGVILASLLIDSFLLKIPNLSNIPLMQSGANGDAILATIQWSLFPIVMVSATVLWFVMGGFKFFVENLKILKDEQQGRAGGGMKFLIEVASKSILIIAIVGWPLVYSPILSFVDSTAFFFYDKVVSVAVESASNSIKAGGGKNITMSAIYTRPLTTLVEAGLLLPFGPHKWDTERGEAMPNPSVQIDVINESLAKAMHQRYRMGKMYQINDAASAEKQQNTAGSGGVSVVQASMEGNIQTAIVSVFYIAILFMVMKLLFQLLFSLGTRFIKVIIGTVTLPFSMVLYGTPMMKHVGKRQLFSYAGDILVTPLLVFNMGLAILIMAFMIKGMGLDAPGVSDGLAGLGSDESASSLSDKVSIGLLLMAFVVFFILRHFNNIIERVCANFESYISIDENKNLPPDTYGNPNDAAQFSDTVKSVGSMVGGAMGTAYAQGHSGLGVANRYINPTMPQASNNEILKAIQGGNGAPTPNSDSTK